MRKQGFVEILVTVSLIVIAVGVALSYKYLTKAPDDNVVEETVEQIIKKEIGLDLDLTPNSVEKK